MRNAVETSPGQCSRLAFTLMRRDPHCGGFGYVERQHHTLRAALRSFPRERDDVLLYRTEGFITRGSLVGLRQRQVIQLEKP